MTKAATRGEPLMTDDRQFTPNRPAVTHDVKSWTMLFQPMFAGIKTHDIRLLDRDYQIGDYLMLREYNWGEKKYTGRTLLMQITYATCARRGDPLVQRSCAFSPTCLHPDYGVFSVRKVRAQDAPFEDANGFTLIGH